MKTPSIREQRYFKQIVRTMDTNQLKYHQENNYPAWEKVFTKMEINIRRGLMFREIFDQHYIV